jgi:hypothetical protein
MPERTGTPKTDSQRAATHYGITEAEYLADPSAYPLPARGSGAGIGAGAVVAIVVILALIFGGRNGK